MENDVSVLEMCLNVLEFCVYAIVLIPSWLCLENDNETIKIVERYNMKHKDLPLYKLFLQGRSEPIAFTGNMKSSDDIIRFIISESGNDPKWSLIVMSEVYMLKTYNDLLVIP